MDSMEKKVRKMEEKLLLSHCENCECTEGCAKQELNQAIKNRLKVLKGNKTVLK